MFYMISEGVNTGWFSAVQSLVELHFPHWVFSLVNKRALIKLAFNKRHKPLERRKKMAQI